MSSLPNIIPEQTAKLGTVDDSGNVTIDLNWYLFLYNVATQVLSSNAGGITVSPTDLLLLGNDYVPIAANTTSSSTVKICVLGDSLTAQNFLLRDAWPAVFQRTMNAADAPCTVVNLAIDGCSFYRALQPVGYSGPTNYVFGTNTMVQECIEQKPQLVLVMLGFNDAITAVDGRNLTQIQSDATATFAALRAGLPTAKIVYVSELPYDNVNFTVTASTCNVQTKGVVPYLYQPNTAGITAFAYCTEALNNTLSSAFNTWLETWFSLDVAIKALNSAAGVDSFFTMWYWKIARLGTLGPDMLHPTAAGSILESGYIMKGIIGLPFVSMLFPKIINQNYEVWNDPDTLFSTFMFQTGSGYFYDSDGGACDEWIQQDGCRFQIYPFDDSWFLPYHTRCTLSPRSALSSGPPQTYQTGVSNDSASMFNWEISHGPPFAGVQISIDGGAFSFLGQIVSYEGFAIGIGSGFSTGLSVATHTIRYKCVTGGGAQEIYGPFSFIVTAAANGGNFTTLATSGAATLNSLIVTTQNSWTGVAYANSWVDFGGGFYGVAYMIDSLGFVHLRGIMKSGTLGTTAFTLPVGARPVSNIAQIVGSNSAAGFFTLTSGGLFQPSAGSSNTSFSCDGIVFWPG